MFFRIPRAEASRPDVADRVSAFTLVIVPWVVLYNVAGALGSHAARMPVYFSFEEKWPVVAWTVSFYVSLYAMIPLAALLAPTRAVLREYMRAAIVAMCAGIAAYLLLPLAAPPRAFVAGDFWGWLLLLNRSLDVPGGGNAFPSFHVVWALISMGALAERGGFWRLFAPLWAVAVSVSCVTTGQHGLVDVAGGVVIYVAVRNRSNILRACMRAVGRPGG